LHSFKTGYGTRKTGFGTCNTGHGTRKTGFGTCNTGHGTRKTGFGTCNTGHGTPCPYDIWHNNCPISDMSHRGRRSIRLKKYDYRSNALYYVTICTNRKDIIFGQIKNGKLILNDFGKIARREWIKTARIRTYVELDAFIIMPDHIHGIILINGNNHDQCRGMACHAPYYGCHAPCYGCQDPPKNTYHAHFNNNMKITRKFSHPIKKSLSTIIGAYKSAVSKEINKLRNKSGRSVWQRNYFEHVIRDEKELFAIRQYIINNPKKII